LNQKKFLWRVYLPFVFLSVVPLVILGFYASSLFKDSLLVIDFASLQNRTALIKEKLETTEIDSLDFQKFVIRYDNLSGARVTLIEPTGNVIADSREDAAQMDNHADRPEVKEALSGSTGNSQRYSFTLKEDFMYSAMPVYASSGTLRYIIRTGYPLTFVKKESSGAITAIIFSIIFFAVTVIIIGYLSLKNILQPVSEIKLGAERFSHGDYEQKIFVSKEGELKEIADSINSMAKQLDEKLDIIGEQSNLQQVVLESM
jgi:two-component system phosphate regulon sensor histidine kinase PhoR